MDPFTKDTQAILVAWRQRIDQEVYLLSQSIFAMTGVEISEKATHVLQRQLERLVRDAVQLTRQEDRSQRR